MVLSSRPGIYAGSGGRLFHKTLTVKLLHNILTAISSSERQRSASNESPNSRFSVFLHRQIVRVTLSVSGRGLIALPAAMRKAAGIRPQDNLIAETTSEGILLRPAVTLPVEIYTRERIAEFDAGESELNQFLKLAGRQKIRADANFSGYEHPFFCRKKRRRDAEPFWNPEFQRTHFGRGRICTGRSAPKLGGEVSDSHLGL